PSPRATRTPRPPSTRRWSRRSTRPSRSARCTATTARARSPGPSACAPASPPSGTAVPGPTVTAEPGVPEDVVAFLHHAAAVFATGSAEHIIAELFTEDAVVADHRPLFGTTSSGTEELRAYVRATFEVIP